MSPAEIGRRLGLSEDAVVSLVAMLAREGKVHIGLVESTERHAVAA
jgi:DNA-binding CsgD family transcriptional regulator